MIDAERHSDRPCPLTRQPGRGALRWVATGLVALLVSFGPGVPAHAQLDAPRTERLFMCPCAECLKQGKWLPNCADRNCRPGQILRIQLRKLEADGRSDDEIAREVEKEHGPAILAAPGSRQEAGGTVWFPVAIGLAFGALTWVAIVLVRAIRPRRATAATALAPVDANPKAAPRAARPTAAQGASTDAVAAALADLRDD